MFSIRSRDPFAGMKEECIALVGSPARMNSVCMIFVHRDLRTSAESRCQPLWYPCCTPHHVGARPCVSTPHGALETVFFTSYGALDPHVLLAIL